MTGALDSWLDQQYRHCAGALMLSVSPVTLIKSRPGFGQRIRAVKGSVVASPVLADWDPEPDYFFHWFRDSAVVMDAVRLLFEAGDLGPPALEHFGDFVRFSLALQDLDGRKVVATPAWRDTVTADFVKFLRADTELAATHGDAIFGEPRVNPDGTLDISRWSRPQHDGPPLRALTTLRWLQAHPLDPELSRLASRLLQSDLAFTFAHWREPSFDVWEDFNGRHYYTLGVCAAALRDSAAWLASVGEASLSASYAAEAQVIHRVLDGYWLPEERYYRSCVSATDEPAAENRDISVMLAAVHGAGDGFSHTVRDPRQQSTLQRLEELFDSIYPINHSRAVSSAPAMGRFAADEFFGGNPWYCTTLGAAEFCFMTAAVEGDRAAYWIAKGNDFLQTVRRYTPDNGDLSEQFDKHTGAQTSARHLAWSYAAFISCMRRRRAVLGGQR